MRDAGYPKWLAFTGSLAEHRLVEAMKTAFALRTHLADSGPCTNGTICTPGTSMVLNSTLSASFADSLRSHHTPTIVLSGWLSLHLTRHIPSTRGQAVGEERRHISMRSVW